ncbi:MAG TPA: DUF6760 family protein [Fimbriimonadaceae bacterium]|nr:DUF6760 family protein [Fimbriimonadaceae bacterium]
MLGRPLLPPGLLSPHQRSEPRRGNRPRARVVGGGIARYPSDALYEEVAYIAYHFHWSLDEILALEHRERHKWVAQISKINRRLSGGD